MISEAHQVEVKAFVWNEGQNPEELSWEGPDLFDRIQHDLTEKMETFEFGKLVKTTFHPLFVPDESAVENELLLFRAFTDEFRGRQIVSGVDVEDLNTRFEECKRFCAQKVFTPAELYALKPIRVGMSWHTVLVHFPEINFDFDKDASATIELAGRMETRTIVDHDYDGRRGWTLQTVWFDGKPVMVVNSSGRDGNEYHERWITDGEAFGHLVSWLQTFTLRKEITGYVKADAVLPAMTEFYGHTIHDYYDVKIQEQK